MCMRMKKKIIPLAISALVASSIPAALVSTSTSPSNKHNIYQISESSSVDERANLTNFTFYLGKNSGIPFGGKDIVQWQIKDKDGNLIKDDKGNPILTIDDVDDGFIDGKYQLSLPSGSYTAELYNPLIRNEHYIHPNNVIHFDSSNTDVNLTYEPVLWDDTTLPDRTWQPNDVLYNYKLNDVNGKGFSFQRNKQTEKLTVLFFFKTTCPHSRKTLGRLSEVIMENGWQNKVNVICVSSKDNPEVLKNFANNYCPTFRYVDVLNDDLKDTFLKSSGYPSLAFIDYQGVLDTTEDGEPSKGQLRQDIKRFSKPGLLDKADSEIPKANDNPINPSIPELDHNGHPIGNDEPYLDLPANGKLPEKLEDLKKIKPEAIASVKRYDSRDYGIVTPIKNQGKEGLCWTYATAAASETSILREGLSPITPNRNDLINLSEHNLDYGTRQRTADFDLLGLNPRDLWTGQKGTGNVVVNATDALSMWNSPIEEKNQVGNGYNYVPADYYLEDTIRITNTINLSNKIGWDATINAIKQIIARYGAITASYTCAGTFDYTNTNLKPNNGGHAVTIVGWDDDIPADRYNPTAKMNGGWIVKNSWGGREQLPNADGYFYMSYDSEIDDMTAFDYSKAHELYDNNYYYDAKTTSPGMPDAATHKPAAAIYRAKKAGFDTKEVLKAVNVGIIGENVTATAKIYLNPESDFDKPKSSANKPETGELVATVSETFKHGGYKTLELYDPIELKPGDVFSIVVELKNPTHDADLFYGADESIDNMTFYKDDSGNWVNPMQKLKGAAARIKAFTQSHKIENASSTDLKDAQIKLSSTSYRFADPLKPQVESVKIGEKELSIDDYEIVYNKPVYTMKASDAGANNVVIGKSTITIQGKGEYYGQQTVKYDILTGIAPDLQGKGWYEKTRYNDPRILNMRVKASAKKYRDIELPIGFKWDGDDNLTIDFNKPLPIKYIGEDKEYYRFIYFSSPYDVILHPMNSDDFKPIPPEFDPNTPPPDENVEDAPVVNDPEYDLSLAEVKLEAYDFTYEGQPIQPRVIDVINTVGFHPNIEWNFDIQYKNNDAPGIGKVIIKPKSSSIYFGKKEIEFTIRDKSGNVPTVDPNAPRPNQNLKSVSIKLNRQEYNPDDAITATAIVNPNTLIGLRYEWEVTDGKYLKKLNINQPKISINADNIYNGKQLKVTVFYKEEEVFNAAQLIITNKALPDAPTVNPPPAINPSPNPDTKPPVVNPEPPTPGPVVPPNPTPPTAPIEPDLNPIVPPSRPDPQPEATIQDVRFEVKPQYFEGETIELVAITKFDHQPKTTVTYTWYLNGEQLSSSQSPTLTIPAKLEYDNADLFVLAKHNNKKISSEHKTINVVKKNESIVTSNQKGFDSRKIIMISAISAGVVLLGLTTTLIIRKFKR